MTSTEAPALARTLPPSEFDIGTPVEWMVDPDRRETILWAMKTFFSSRDSSLDPKGLMLTSPASPPGIAAAAAIAGGRGSCSVTASTDVDCTGITLPA